MTTASVERSVADRLDALEGDGEPHDHFALLYGSALEQFEVVPAFVERGLARGERVVYATAGTVPEACAALAAAGVPVESARAAGDLEVREARELYLPDGRFDPERMLGTVEEMIAETERGPRTGLRITADLTAAVVEADAQAFAAYESAVNEVYGASDDLVGLCQYDATAVPEDVVDHVVETHPLLACRRVLGENAFYRPPDQWRADADPPVEDRLDAHRTTHRARARATAVERALHGCELVTTLVREGIRAAMDADDHEAVETSLCRALADQADVLGAWLCDVGYDEATASPRHGAGPAAEAASGFDGRLEAATAAAADAGAVRVVADLGADGRAGGTPGSAASVPVTHDGLSYGVLTIRTSRVAAFGERDRGALAQLGAVVGHVLHAVEQTTALREHRACEVEVAVDDGTFPFAAWCRRADATLEADEVILKGERDLLVRVRSDASTERLLTAADAIDAVAGARSIEAAGDETVFDVTLAEPFVGTDLRNQWFHVESVRADPSGGTLVVRTPTPVGARALVDDVDERYPGSELVAKRTGVRPSAPPPATAISERLTDRQREVATVAYRLGYFETPRECTGEAVADALDVSPQAFYQHVRRIQQRIVETLVESGDRPSGRD